MIVGDWEHDNNDRFTHRSRSVPTCMVPTHTLQLVPLVCVYDVTSLCVYDVTSLCVYDVTSLCV